MNRNQKQALYNEKYKDIPIDFFERLDYMCDKYKLSQSKMIEILDKRDSMIDNLYLYDYQIIQLLEEPEGSKRPRFRLVNRKNLCVEALSNSQFVHVYTPSAKDDNMYMRRLMDDEIVQLQGFVNTPCVIDYTAYLRTPSYFDIADTFLSEIGLIRPSIDKPDWDNIGKKYCDMYNHNVWLDDSMVIDGSVHKYYSILPRIEIKLRFMNAIYNKKILNKIIGRKDYDGSPIRYLDREGKVLDYDVTATAKR